MPNHIDKFKKKKKTTIHERMFDYTFEFNSLIMWAMFHVANAHKSRIILRLELDRKKFDMQSRILTFFTKY